MADGPATGQAREATVVFEQGPDDAIVVKELRIGKPPSHIRVVQFKNNTDGKVQVWIPRGASLFVPPGDGHFDGLEIAANGSLSLRVQDEPKEGKYPYHVFCACIDGYAKGGSPPTVSCP